jgi:hypothetical protein
VIRIKMFDIGGGQTRRMYENLVPVGALRGGDGTNQDTASNQLVQFFLRKFFAKHPELLPSGPARTRGFLLDGKVGPQTITGINRFQSFASKGGFPIIVDSRVSVATGVNVPGTEVRWTIHALNSFYALRSGETDFDSLFANKEIEAEAPELQADLIREEQLLRS